MDQELCNPTDSRGQCFTLVAATVQSGRMKQEALDRAAANVLRAKFAAGLFDKPLADPAETAKINTPAHQAIAKRIAAEGSILLQNDGGPRGLPLTGLGPKSTIAIIGALANDTHSQCGGYTNFGARVVTVLEAAASYLPGTKLLYAQGAGTTGNSTGGFAAALDAAAQADAVVVVVGDSGAKGWTMNTCGEDDDRTQLDLTGKQPELLAALAANLSHTQKPLITVLIHGRPVSFVRGDILPQLPAVLAAWRPGQQGGAAIWELLLGKQSPSGRLSQAWPRSAGFVHSQASPWFSKRQGDFDHEAYRGGASQQPGKKQIYDWAPLFPFGHGGSTYRVIDAVLPTWLASLQQHAAT
jgi:beta-glucosidase